MTNGQQRFADEYLIDLNATQAAIRAGFSKKSAYSQGARLLKNDKVARYIDQKRAEISEKCGITAERVLEEYAKIAFSNMKDYVSSGNTPLEVTNMDDDIAAAIQEVGTEEKEFNGTITTQRKLKLYSKLDALEKLGRHLGIFERDNSQKKDVIMVGYGNDDEDDE